MRGQTICLYIASSHRGLPSTGIAQPVHRLLSASLYRAYVRQHEMLSPVVLGVTVPCGSAIPERCEKPLRVSGQPPDYPRGSDAHNMSHNRMGREELFRLIILAER